MGETAQYTASESSGVDYGDFIWNSDGADLGAGPSGGTNATTQCGWSTPGTYVISASATNAAGTGSGTLTITVQDNTPADPAPQVSINGPTTLDTNDSGSFSVSNSGGSITSYAWSTTGAGGSGSTDTFSASWTSPNTYTITLQVTGPGGNATATLDLVVSDPPPTPSPFGMNCNATTAEVGNIFRCTLGGDSANFSDPVWTVSTPSESWYMDEWTRDAAGTVADSDVTVQLTVTDLATGLTVTASDTVAIEAAAPPPPADSPLAIACNPGTAAIGVRVNCGLTTDPANFSGPSWAVTSGAAQS